MGRYNQGLRLATLAGLFFVASLSTAVAQEAKPPDAPQETDHEKAVAHYNQGEAFFKAGTYDKAVEEYEKAYALVPRAGLLFNIALAHEKSGKRDKAIEAFDRYLLADPNAARKNEALARKESLVRDRDQEAAAKIKVDGHRRRADTLLQQREFIAAIAELRLLHQLSNNAGLLFEIAQAYEGAGEDELAYEEYGRYLETGHRDHGDIALEKRKALDAKLAAKRAAENRQKLKQPSLIGPAVASGVTLALLGVGVGFGLRARSLESELDTALGARNPPLDNGDPRFDDGRSAASTANLFFIGSGVAAGAAAFLWYRFFSQQGEYEDIPTTYVAPTESGFAIGGTF